MTAGRVGVVVLVCLLGVAVLASLAVGADPSAGTEPLVGGDPRSDGAGPGIVGSPLLILAAVVALGMATALLTVLIARLTQRD